MRPSNRHLGISWNSDSVSAAASSSPKIRVVMSDSEARLRNRCLGMSIKKLIY